MRNPSGMDQNLYTGKKYSATSKMGKMGKMGRLDKVTND